MSKNFIEEAELIFERNYKPSLKILLEEEGDEEETEEPLEDTDLGSTPKPESGDDSGKSSSDSDSKSKEDESEESSEPSEESSELEDMSPEQSEDLIAKDLENVNSTLEDINHTIDGNISSSVETIQNHIQSFVSGFKNESYTNVYKDLNIKDFLFELKDDKLEKNLEKVQGKLDKAKGFIDGYKKGSKVVIDNYVAGAINAFENFDNLFSKESFIIQAVINLLVLNTGSKAKNYIEEFKELFAKELNKRGIVYDESVLNNTKFKSAVGARSTG